MKFGNTSFTVDDVDQLTYKSIKCIWLLSCNTGHYNYKSENMAYVLSKKIAGVIVAPDGLVYSGDYEKHYYAMVSEGVEKDSTRQGLDAWYMYRNNKGSSRSNSYGWTMYRCAGGTLVQWEQLFVRKKFVNIEMIAKCMKTKGYICYK